MGDRILKCVVVGEPKVGKSTLVRRLSGTPADLLASYDCNDDRDPNTPFTIAEIDAYVNISSRDTLWSLKFWESAPFEGYSRLQPLLYARTDVFVLCFSIGDRRTLRELSRWSELLLHHSDKASWLVIGLWTFDFRKHGGNEMPDVSPEQVARTVTALRRQHRGVIDYAVCDAYHDEEVQPILEKVSRRKERSRS